MSTVTLELAASQLQALIDSLHPGDEIIITRNDQPVARLIGERPPAPTGKRKLGTMKGSVTYMAPDFDAPLDDFKEYME